MAVLRKARFASSHHFFQSSRMTSGTSDLLHLIQGGAAVESC
jgi:hypothetical protein